MTTVTPDRRVLQLDVTARDGAPAQPAWLHTLRETARARFDELGLPTLRDEEWRFTNLKPIATTPFEPATDPRREIDADVIARFAYPGLDADRLVFVNGRFAAGLSSIASTAAGVVIETLAEAVTNRGDAIRARLERDARTEHAFTALNLAGLEDGVFVQVPDGVVVERPIHVLGLTTAPSGPIATHPRILVEAGASSRLTLIEEYVCPGDDVYLTNAVTDIVVGANADVRHYLIERESERAFNVTSLEVTQHRDSRFASHSVLLGGALVRNNVHPVLAGENCHSLLNGLYVGRGTQHIDNHMRVEHSSPHCDSRQYYKGILLDEASGVFSGRIVVDQIAQKTDAVQSNANLLLSPNAQARTKPQLEIYADDVKCTHGATIGQLDENALFYLRSRGLSADAARGVLVHAFAEESLERMDLEPIHVQLGRMLHRRLETDAARRLLEG